MVHSSARNGALQCTPYRSTETLRCAGLAAHATPPTARERIQAMPHRLINADCLDWLRATDERFATVFADPPDAIGLKYEGFVDRFADYYGWCEQVLAELLRVAPVVWWSFNSQHTIEMAIVVKRLGCLVKPCVQVFTFGQNRRTDLGNGHRPLWRLSTSEPTLYPEQVKVPSWRILNGDKRAADGGCVPLDVFDFPRVTGNSKQRRPWHPTQLHEGLVERCIKLTSREGERVLDPFGGAGTTLRVCKAINRQCTLIEMSPVYCQHLAAEHLELITSPADQWRAIVQAEAKAAGNAILGLIHARQKFPALAALAEPRTERTESTESPADSETICEAKGI